jgi:UDP-glucose 4-epimerase
MWLMLQQDQPDDYVIAIGETHSVQEFLELAFARVDLDWKEFVRHDIRYKRPAEVDLLVGDASKAKRALSWEPKVRLPECSRSWSMPTSPVCKTSLTVFSLGWMTSVFPKIAMGRKCDLKPVRG